MDTREQHSRRALRYQSDLTAAEWAVIAPHLPPVCGWGRPLLLADVRIINDIFCVMRAGCPWPLLPSDFPPWEMIYRCFAAFRDEARFEKINHALVMMDREGAGRGASPSGAILDSESVKTTDAARPRGYDAGKKIKGRKRHALVDTDGCGPPARAASGEYSRSRRRGGPLLCASRGPFPFIERVFTDSGYAGQQVAEAAVIAVEIASKSPDQVGFAVQPRRGTVECFFAWINRNRRLAKDFEAIIDSARAFLYAASVMLLVRRLPPIMTFETDS